MFHQKFTTDNFMHKSATVITMLYILIYKITGIERFYISLSVYQYLHNLLPHDIILDRSKLKAFAHE